MNTDRIRRQMLLTIDFDQVDTPMIARAKTAIRNASDEALTAAFEASKADRSFGSAIRDAARAGGLNETDLVALVQRLAFESVM